MKSNKILSSVVVAFEAVMALGASAWAATVQIGASDKTFASSMVQCTSNPSTGVLSPVVDAGLFNPTNNASANVKLNGVVTATVTAAAPSTQIWLVDGNNSVVVAINKKTVDSYAFAVQPGMCALPDTSGNTFSADGTLEYAASGKSYATVTPGCALNPATGQAQPYVNLFDNGSYLLNVSVNSIPLTQLSASRPHTPVFLSAGQNVISAVNGYLTTDYFTREVAGDGTCTLP